MGTQGLKMENGGQSELKRFGVVSRMERGFVRSILSTFPVLMAKGDSGGILGYFPDFEWIRAGKPIFIPN